MYADNVALPAFARQTPLLQQSIDSPVRRAHSSKPEAALLLLWAQAGTDRQTYTVPFHRPALHIMLAMPINDHSTE